MRYYYAYSNQFGDVEVFDTKTERDEYVSETRDAERIGSQTARREIIRDLVSTNEDSIDNLVSMSMSDLVQMHMDKYDWHYYR